MFTITRQKHKFTCMTTRTTRSIISNEAVWSFISCHKKCTKCPHSSVCLHTHLQTSSPLSNCSTDDLMVKSGQYYCCACEVTLVILDTLIVFTYLLTSAWVAQRGGRRHGFACGRRAPAVCPRLHSPPGWNQGCLEATAHMIRNSEFHDAASRQSHGHGEQSMLTSESTSWNVGVYASRSGKLLNTIY